MATFTETFIKVLYVGEMKLMGYIFFKFHLLTFNLDPRLDDPSLLLIGLR